MARAPLSPAQVEQYEAHGFVDVGPLFTGGEMEAICAGAARRLHPANRPAADHRPDNLVNLHAPPIDDSWVLVR